MGNVFADIPPPGNWQDFERLTLDICRAKWLDDYAELNGRAGQSQNGVDICGYDQRSRLRTGVQCKKRMKMVKGVTAPSSSLTEKEIDVELAAAKSFTPALDCFIIATTGQRDSKLQSHVRKINVANVKPVVALWFWDDFVEYLNTDNNLMYRYYENILKYRNAYAPGTHYLRMLAMAFDRPAIRTSFHLENRATDFIHAISALQQAISTGILKDNDGHIVDQVCVVKVGTNEITNIKRALQQIRTKATEALKTGAIVEHPTVIEIKDGALQEALNRLRRDAVNNLNSLLRSASIEEIQIHDY